MLFFFGIDLLSLNFKTILSSPLLFSSSGIQSHFDVSDVMEKKKMGKKKKKTLLCHMLADGSEALFESCSAPGDDGSSRSVTNAERRGRLSKLRVSNPS